VLEEFLNVFAATTRSDHPHARGCYTGGAAIGTSTGVPPVVTGSRSDPQAAL
jgi:hypothetical protein